jgi:hypothetical protein
MSLPWRLLDIRMNSIEDVAPVQVVLRITLRLGLGETPVLFGPLKEVINTTVSGKERICQVPLSANDTQSCQTAFENDF